LRSLPELAIQVWAGCQDQLSLPNLNVPSLRVPIGFQA
jgi:hypothetical protein